METTQKKRVTLTVVETAAADVAVYGAELVGKKCLTNMAIILNALGSIFGGHGVRTAVFSTDVPKDMIASCAMDSGTITLNVMGHFCGAFERCIDKPEIAAGFMFWHNIYVSIIHETLHLQNPDIPEKEITADAVKALYSIVKEYNIEPGASPFLIEQMREATLYDTDPVIMKQKAMWEEGTAFDDGKLVLKNYRDFAHLFSGDDDKHPEWAQKPKDKFIPIVQAKPSATGHEYTDEEINNFIDEEMADLLSPVAGNTPEAIAFNKAAGAISEFRNLAVVADNAAIAGDSVAFMEAVNKAKENEIFAKIEANAINDRFYPSTEYDVNEFEVDGGIGEDFEDDLTDVELASAIPQSYSPHQTSYQAPVSVTPQFVSATPEQLSQIKAFIMAGNSYLPEEHSNIGTPQQLINLTNELYAEIAARMNVSMTRNPAPIGLQPIPKPIATVSVLKENDNIPSMIRTLPETGLTMERTAEIMRGVYTKCFNHVFGNCGQLLNSAVGFANPSAVLTPIELTPEERQIVVGFNYHGEMNPGTGRPRWCKAGTEAGSFIGYVGTGQQLPSYKLFINMDGVELCRFLIPQNPNKMKGPSLSSKAILARKGMAIMYVMEGDDAVKNAGGPQYLYKAVISRTNFNIPAVATDDSWHQEY